MDKSFPKDGARFVPRTAPLWCQFSVAAAHAMLEQLADFLLENRYCNDIVLNKDGFIIYGLR